MRGLFAAVSLLVTLSSHATAQVVDVTPPTVTAAATTAPNANGWYRTAVRVRFTCADAGRIAFCPPAVLVSTDGEDQVISGTARDRAGNTATASITLNIDRTAPVVTALRSPEAPPTGWATTPVTVTFAATDALSGLAPGTLTAPVTLATDRTNGSATGRATDLAGNVGTFKLTGINIDQRAPRITVSLSPAVSRRGYRTGVVTAHFTCTDARSGVVSCPADQVFPDDGVAQSVTGTVFDVAGHSSTVTKVFNLDATPPVLGITAPEGDFVADPTTTITGTVTDALSGVASLTVNGRALRIGAGGTFSSGPLALADGANTFTLAATDRAGNVRQHIMTLRHGCNNLVADPQFDAGESGFMAQDDSSSVQRTADSPIDGAHSLRIARTRTLELTGSVLRVIDACSVAAGVRPVFQLQVPALPVLQEDGTIVAGALRIVPLQPATVAWTAMAAPEFSRGYRIDITSAAGCGFSVELRPQ